LEQRPFALRECVEAALDVLAARAAEKKIDLVGNIEPGVPEKVVGDDTRLRQVMINLLSNAVKFTSRGEVFLSLPAPSRTAGAVRLRLGVHDSGIGIPRDRMDRLFKTFSQVDASTTRQYGGTGLGLAISKRIVELMRGRIWVESVEGRGSVFYVEVELPTVDTETKVGGERLAGLAGRRVLIVDDNATSCRVLCQQCVTWGIVPRAVSSGAEALALLGQETFDAVLVDAEMPTMTGVELVAEMRRRERLARMPVALLTWPGQGKAGEELGIAGFVNKPIKTALLQELLIEVLCGRRSAQATPAPTGPNLGEQHPLTILLAEDNPVNQRVATLMLQRLGYGVDVAANGREAVEAVMERVYDLVLMDVQMPEMDGLQAAREICALNKARGRARPRIVAMTANATTGDRDLCLAAGMDEFLAKPVRAADLRKALLATPARCVASAA